MKLSRRFDILGWLIGLTISSSLLAATDWQKELQQSIPALGHRNWVVIVDSAYPLQTAPGVKLVATQAGQLVVVQAVLAELAKSKHVRPRICLDAELNFVPESFAPGIGQYRTGLQSALGALPVTTLPHEELIARLEHAGRSFHVLVLKSNMTLPYTSVFIELECGYWSDEAEQALRDAMSASPAKG